MRGLRPDRRALCVRPAGRRRDHERRPRAPRAGRRPRRRRPGEGRADRRAARRRDRRRPRRTSRSRATTSRSFGSARTSSSTRRALHDALRRARGQLHGAPPRPERADRARDGERARPRDARAPRRRVHRVAEPGAPAPGRRRPDQRRLEREPRLDARRARAPRRARRRPPDDRRARRHGRARRLQRQRGIARWARAAAELVDEVVAIGPQAVAYGGRHVDTVDEAVALLERCCGPATACSSRAPGRWASSASPRRSRERRRSGRRPDRRHRRDGDLDRRRPALHQLPAEEGVRAARSARKAPPGTRSSRGRRRWAAC